MVHDRQEVPALGVLDTTEIMTALWQPQKPDVDKTIADLLSECVKNFRKLRTRNEYSKKVLFEVLFGQIPSGSLTLVSRITA
jgi:hypothetical protein